MMLRTKNLPLLLLMCSAAYSPVLKQGATQQKAHEKLDWSTTSPITKEYHRPLLPTYPFHISKIETEQNGTENPTPRTATESYYTQKPTPSFFTLATHPSLWPKWLQIATILITYGVFVYFIINFRKQNPKPPTDAYAGDSEDAHHRTQTLEQQVSELYRQRDEQNINLQATVTTQNVVEASNDEEDHELHSDSDDEKQEEEPNKTTRSFPSISKFEPTKGTHPKTQKALHEWCSSKEKDSSGKPKPLKLPVALLPKITSYMEEPITVEQWDNGEVDVKQHPHLIRLVAKRCKTDEQVIHIVIAQNEINALSKQMKCAAYQVKWRGHASFKAIELRFGRIPHPEVIAVEEHYMDNGFLGAGCHVRREKVRKHRDKIAKKAVESGIASKNMLFENDYAAEETLGPLIKQSHQAVAHIFRYNKKTKTTPPPMSYNEFQELSKDEQALKKYNGFWKRLW